MPQGLWIGVGNRPRKRERFMARARSRCFLGGHRRDAARHHLAALGDVTHQQLGILVVDLRRVAFGPVNGQVSRQ